MHWKLSKTLLAALLILSSGQVYAETFGSTEDPLPNVTELKIYDVTELSGEDRYTDGELVDEGLNKTFETIQQDGVREYRFSFRITNDGEQEWNITDQDQLFYDGLNESWSSTRIWYNLSEEYEGGTFEDGRITWNTSEGSLLQPGEEMNAQYTVETDLERSHLLEQEFLVNNTETESGSQDVHELDTTKLGFLNVELEDPVEETTLAVNRTFLMNSTVTCMEGECGDVDVVPRYNESESADTVIPEDSGEPFHTVEDPALQTCEDLEMEKCRVTWDVNASGEKETFHLLDVRADSAYEQISEESSTDTTVQINIVVLMDLEWDVIDFGILDPGTENSSATGNDELKYNITIGEDSNEIDDLWVRSTDLQSQENEDYSIGAGNISYSFEDDVSTSETLSNTYQSVKSNISPGSVLSTFYWLDVPTGIYKGGYNGTMYFKANVTG